MKNLDFNKEEIKEKAIKAINEGNVEEQAEILQAWVEGVAQDVAKEVAKEQKTLENDTMILTSRGTKQLTSEEIKYYEKVAEAMKSTNPKQALTELDVVMPTTTINRVFEDIEEAHPLLKLIKVNNVTGLTETIARTGDIETAWWGPLCDEIKKELEAGFKKESTTLYKLSAFLPICKAYLTLGPTWLDKFIRTILTESMTNGLVKAIVSGTGINSPIGMDCDLETAFTPGEARPKKTAQVIKDFEPKTLGKIIAKLTNKGKRIVTKVALIVNPIDYWEKVFALTTTKNALGQYVANQFPFPVDIIQESSVNQGKAIIGLPEKYDLNVGMNQKIEYDDSVRFLDDERVYLAKMYANGKAVDNNSFILLDISKITVDDTTSSANSTGSESSNTESKG